MMESKTMLAQTAALKMSVESNQHYGLLVCCRAVVLAQTVLEFTACYFVHPS